MFRARNRTPLEKVFVDAGIALNYGNPGSMLFNSLCEYGYEEEADVNILFNKRVGVEVEISASGLHVFKGDLLMGDSRLMWDHWDGESLLEWDITIFDPITCTDVVSAYKYFSKYDLFGNLVVNV